MTMCVASTDIKTAFDVARQQMMKNMIEKSGEMGPGTTNSKFVVNKHLCRQEEGRHNDQDENSAAQNCRSRKSSRFWNTRSIKPKERRSAWRRGCRVRARSGREM